MADNEQLKLPRAPHSTDARGRSVTLLDPYSLHLLRRYVVIEAEPLRQMAREFGRGVSKWHRRVYWIGFAVGLYSVGSAVLMRVRSGAGVRFEGVGDVAIVLFLIVFFGGLTCTYAALVGLARGVCAT